MTTKSNLFVVRSRPVKIFLEGFVYCDVLTIAKLILAHGGVVASEPDEETIVLSPPSGSSSGQYARFKVSWLHDCISANHFLDVAKYILPTAEFKKSAMSTDNKAQNIKKKKEEHIKIETDVNASAFTSYASRAKKAQIRMPMLLHPKTSPRTAIEEQMESTTDCLEEPKTQIKTESIILSVANNAGSGEMEPDECNKGRKKLSINSEFTSTSTSRDADCSASSSGSGVIRKQKKQKTSSTATHSPKRPHKLYSLAESRRLIDYVIKSDAISKANSRLFWRNAKAEGMFEDRGVDSLLQHFCTYLTRHDPRDYTSDHSVLTELEQLKKQLAAPNPSTSFSEEENERMIQFIIECRAFRRLSGTEIWKKMERDSIFCASSRSAVSLRQHFQRYMHKNFHKYTQNLEALEQFRSYFKKAAMSKRKPTTQYSEEEKKRMIEFIIENRAIGRLSTVEIWKEMANDDTFRASHRSATNLRLYFARYMYKNFHNYTQNSEALKEFRSYFKEAAMNKRELIPYSEEERRKIIQYLIDNGAISNALSYPIWKKAEAAEVFVEPRRSAAGLYCYFCKYLRYQYMNYTDNPRVLSEFKKLIKQ